MSPHRRQWCRRLKRSNCRPQPACAQCVVWHQDGRLIGGADAFSTYCKNTYSVTSDLDLEDLPGICQENTDVVKKMFAEESAGDAVLLQVGDTKTLY